MIATIFYTLLIFILLLTDISQFFLLNTQLVALALPLYITTLFTQNFNYQSVIFGTLFLLETFCFYGTDYYGIIILLPVTVGLQLTKRFFQYTAPQVILWTLGALILQSVLIEKVFLGYKTPIKYTIFKIFATLIVAYFFSLKDKLRGNQGNRV